MIIFIVKIYITRVFCMCNFLKLLCYSLTYLENTELTSDKMNAYKDDFKKRRENLLMAIHKAFMNPA